MSLRARLKRGGRYVVSYRPASDRRLAKRLHAKQSHVAFGNPRKRHGRHIRRRYIALAAGVLVVILAFSAWLFVQRRRTLPRHARKA
jgi:hypothetical protein